MLILNNKIKEVFKEYNIDETQGFIYLFCLEFGLDTEGLDAELKQKVHVSNVVKPVNTGIEWTYGGLFEKQVPEINKYFKWVEEEYIPLFKEVGKHITPSVVKNTTDRIIELFKERPDIRKEDVLNATKYYVSVTNHKVIREPYYFIKKGVGKNAIRDVLTWIALYQQNKVMESLEQAVDFRSDDRKMR